MAFFSQEGLERRRIAWLVELILVILVIVKYKCSSLEVLFFRVTKRHVTFKYVCFIWSGKRKQTNIKTVSNLKNEGIKLEPNEPSDTLY